MLSLADILIVVAFVLYSIGVGLRSRAKASRNLEEYFLAGRTLPGWKAGISMAATQFAADTPLLVTGLIAVAGVFSLWRLWIYAVAFLMLGFLLAASWRRAQVLTDAEFTEIRYGGGAAAVLRGFKALYFGTLFNCTVLAWVLFAAKSIAEPFLLWHQWLPEWCFLPFVTLIQWIGVPLATNPGGEMVWVLSANNLISILAIVAVTALYSTTGGLRSVVNTDILQFALMMVATAVFAWIVVGEVGGLAALPDRIADLFAAGRTIDGISPDQILAFDPWNAKGVTLPLLAVFALQWLVQLNADGTGYLAQRSMACRSDTDAKQAAIVFTVAQVLVRSLLWLPLGLGLLLLFPPDPPALDPHATAPLAQLTAEREMTYVRGIAETLPSGFKGLMLTAMLAALASTVDTHLNWGSSYWTNDIYKRFFCPLVLKREPDPRRLVWVARAANLLILAIALLIMTQLSSIRMAWQTSLLLGAGMGIPLVLRWLWWRMTALAEIAAVVVSLVLAPVLLLTLPATDDDALRLLIMALVSSAAAVVTAWLRGPEDHAVLQAFYRRVRPPGFWSPIARSLDMPDDGPHRLWIGCLMTATAAVSLFCLLVAIGSWLCGSPAPPWAPSRTLYLWTLAIVGFALVPVWWRAAFQSRQW
ncbi:MAG: Na+:solute symporter [Rhodospirillales bacterium]|nr:Na+:solute symporter [Rhodospirillales bacterium]